MAQHTEYKCDGKSDRCERGVCPYCSGGLFCCAMCGGAEASLPTECPGKPMTDEQVEGVLNGTMDFCYGQWMIKFTNGVWQSVTLPLNAKADTDETCICGDKIGSGGWTCRHGGMCLSAEEYYKDKTCPVCGGDCSSANPPVTNCPKNG